MKKITLKFENNYFGINDIIQKEIDCEFQAGTSSASAQLQLVNIQRALCLSIYGFVEKIGIDISVFKDFFVQAYNEYTDEEDVEPVQDLTTSKDLSLNYDSFVNQFLENNSFRQHVFTIFQDYMEDDDEV